MLIAELSVSVVARVSIHASSSQSKTDSPTFEPVRGGISVKRAIGSARVTHSPDWVSSSNL